MKTIFQKLFLFLFFIAACNESLARTALSYTPGDPYLGLGAGIQNKHGYNGLYAKFFGGMNVLMGCRQQIYLAGEIFADTGSLPLSQKRFNRTTYAVGASLIPGLMIYQSTIAYLRAGIATFRYNKTNSYSTGGQLGVGLQTSISSNWDLRGEYVYTGMGIIRGFGTARFNFFNIALLYKFQ